jgi:hypothetical protein
MDYSLEMMYGPNICPRKAAHCVLRHFQKYSHTQRSKLKLPNMAEVGVVQNHAPINKYLPHAYLGTLLFPQSTDSPR